MARPRRLQLPGCFRHVVSRGNGRMTIFLDDVDYRTFLYMLADAVEKFQIECWNYCVMPNHYHATLRPTLPNISSAMRELNGNYGRWWNKRHSRVGHTFQGRFKAPVVQEEGYLHRLYRYIARNPVRASLVQRPEDWEWSSYGATIGLRAAPPFVEIEKVLHLFGGGPVSTLQSHLADYVLNSTEGIEFDERFRSNERILGDAAFKTSVRVELMRQSTPEMFESPAELTLNGAAPRASTEPVIHAASVSRIEAELRDSRYTPAVHAVSPLDDLQSEAT